MSNNVAVPRAGVALAALIALGLGAPAYGQSIATVRNVAPDETCMNVRKVFVGLNDIAKKGNTKIIPFSKDYHAQLIAYFDRGCPRTENFPVPKPGTDMQLAATAGDVVVSGKIKFELGKPLVR